jgi:hypothetical protein
MANDNFVDYVKGRAADLAAQVDTAQRGLGARPIANRRDPAALAAYPANTAAWQDRKANLTGLEQMYNDAAPASADLGPARTGLRTGYQMPPTGAPVGLPSVAPAATPSPAGNWFSNLFGKSPTPTAPTGPDEAFAPGMNQGYQGFTGGYTAPDVPASPAPDNLQLGNGSTFIGKNPFGPTREALDSLQAARVAAGARGDFGAVAQSYQANGGAFNGATAASDAAANAERMQQQREASQQDRLNNVQASLRADNEAPSWRKLGVKARANLENQANVIQGGSNVQEQTRAARATAGATNALGWANYAQKGQHDQQQLLIDSILKGAEADKNTAEGATARMSASMAMQHIMNGGSVGEAAGILHGRPLPADNIKAIPNMTGDKLMMWDSRHPGAPTLETPRQVATQQTVKDTLAAHPEFKGDSARAIQALKDTGRYSVTGLK